MTESGGSGEVTPRVVVLGVGNESRGDDALAPLLLRRLEALDLPGVEVVLDFQLQLEHALDLRDADLALFVDAATGLAQPFVFSEVEAAADTPAFSHALSPAGVLGVFAKVEGRPPPPAFVLAVGGGAFALGEELSAAARANAEAAWALLHQLLTRPQPASWRAMAAAAACPG